MKPWIKNVIGIAPIIAGLVATMRASNPFDSPISPISPPPTPTIVSPISPPPTPTVLLPSRTPPPTATPSVTIHEWYHDCPQPGPCVPQPTYTPAAVPTCRPVPACDQTPYPTSTPYPPQPEL